MIIGSSTDVLIKKGVVKEIGATTLVGKGKKTRSRRTLARNLRLSQVFSPRYPGLVAFWAP